MCITNIIFVAVHLRCQVKQWDCILCCKCEVLNYITCCILRLTSQVNKSLTAVWKWSCEVQNLEVALCIPEWIIFADGRDSWLVCDFTNSQSYPWKIFSQSHYIFLSYHVWFLYCIAEPKYVLNYLQTLRSSEESLKEQVYSLLTSACSTYIQSKYFLRSKPIIMYLILLVRKGEEERSCIYCNFCKKRAGNCRVKGSYFLYWCLFPHHEQAFFFFKLI